MKSYLKVRVLPTNGMEPLMVYLALGVYMDGIVNIKAIIWESIKKANEKDLSRLSDNHYYTFDLK